MTAPVLLVAVMLRPASAEVRAAADPRIECLAVIHLLASEGRSGTGFALNELRYSKDVRTSFERFRGHRAVAAYADAVSGGLTLPEALQLAWEAGASSSAWRTSLAARVGRDRIERFVKEFGRFGHDADFAEFFAAHERMLQGYARQMDDSIAFGSDRSALEQYAGKAIPLRDVVVLSPLLPGPYSDNFPSGGELVWIVGPDGIDGDRPSFQPARRRWDRWHVWTHVLLDSELDRYPQADCSPPEGEAAPCDRSWSQCVREHVARGIADRVASSQGLPQQNGSDLPWRAAVADRLAEYETGRARFPSLDSFYPRLLSALPGFDEGLDASTAAAVGIPLGDKGIRAFEGGRIDEALGDLSRAVELRRRDAKLRLSYGVALMAASRLEEARFQLDEAVRLSIEVCRGGALAADALTTRASLRERVEQPAGASDDLRRALHVAPALWPRRKEVEDQLVRLGSRP